MDPPPPPPHRICLSSYRSVPTLKNIIVPHSITLLINNIRTMVLIKLLHTGIIRAVLFIMHMLSKYTFISGTLSFLIEMFKLSKNILIFCLIGINFESKIWKTSIFGQKVENLDFGSKKWKTSILNQRYLLSTYYQNTHLFFRNFVIFNKDGQVIQKYFSFWYD